MTTHTRKVRSRAGHRSVRGSGRGPARSWLLLTHQIPPTPGYLRVKVRRQLDRIGAVPVKNSVYALPPGDETREDFEWLCREIERNGGETTLCLATFLDDATDERIVAACREVRSAGYRAIADTARELYARHEEELMKDASSTTRTRTRHIRPALEAAIAIDFFDAPGRAEAEEAVSKLEALMNESPEREPAAEGAWDPRPSGRTWVTRVGVKVDRISSAWLIRRFIDRRARFKFVPAHGYVPAKGELRFDMFEGEYTHDGDRCTFETLVRRFALADPALTAIAEIVHDIDIKDDKYGRPERGGVSSLIDGIIRAQAADEERLRRGSAMFDDLYEHFRPA